MRSIVTYFFLPSTFGQELLLIECICFLRYEKNDSTRIYAWYATELTTSIGPEGYCGLPGVILGLATEDGGIVYFAKSVEFVKPTQEELTPDVGKNKIFTLQQLKMKIKKDYGSTPWGKGMFENLFRWL